MNEVQILGVGSRIKHDKYGVGVVTKLLPNAYAVTFVQFGNVQLPYDVEWQVIDAVEPEAGGVSLKDVEKIIGELLQKWGGLQEVVPLGDRWQGGTLILKPEDDSLKAKEVPIEVFFHKIVMVRDRLRVMEQRINSSNLDEEEKINLQQYISRIYGSLTTFNILFKRRDDQFTSS